jgi:transposase InsO family protein
VLEVSRSGYYAWLKRAPSERAKEDFALSAEIKEIFYAHKRNYGSPRIYKELRAKGHCIGKKRVERLMKKNELEAKPNQTYCQTTDSDHAMPVAPNLLERDFTADKPNEKWVGDVTYVRTEEGWLYVASILDLYSRRVVGWSASERNDAELVVEALQQAIQQRRPPKELIMHSDRGSTYASEAHQEVLRKHGMRCSMSRKGDCYDNAVAESFFATLKREGLKEKYESRRAAYQAVQEYMSYYNTRRRHSYLNYESPVAFELKMSQTIFLQSTVH